MTAPDIYAESRKQFIYYASSGAATLLCVALSWISIDELRGIVARQQSGVRLHGVITDIRNTSSIRGQRGSRHLLTVRASAPLAKYTVTSQYQGRTIEVRSQSSYDRDLALPKGAPMTVIYVPQAPEYSRLDTAEERWSLSVMTPIFALISGSIAVRLWLKKSTLVDIYGAATPTHL